MDDTIKRSGKNGKTSTHTTGGEPINPPRYLIKVFITHPPVQSADQLGRTRK
jgi:hypothetical protein